MLYISIKNNYISLFLLRALYASCWFTRCTGSSNTMEGQIGREFYISSNTSSFQTVLLSKSDGRRRCHSLSPAYWSRRAPHRALSEPSTPWTRCNNRETLGISGFFEQHAIETIARHAMPLSGPCAQPIGRQCSIYLLRTC